MNNLSAHMVHPYVYIVFFGISLCFTTQTLALESNKDFTLNDTTGDSPQVILVDGDSKKLVLEKLDSGAANLFNDEGSICLLSSNDRDDIICFATKADRPAIMWDLAGVSKAAEPGIQISSEGKLQYRNKAGSWADFDSLKSTFEIEDGTITSAKLDAAVGTPGQVLSLINDGALKWVTPDAVVIDDNVITSSKIADESVSAVDLATNAVTSLKIADATIVDADINASAAIAGSKVQPDFGAQSVITTGNMSGANITATGDVTVGNAKSLRLPDADGSNYMSLQAPNSMSVNTTLTLPASAGSNGQVLQTDGTGNLDWTTISGAVISDGDLTPAKTSLEDGRILLGNAANQGAAVAISGDISMDNGGRTTIKADAITSAKIANDTIVNTDINASAAIEGTKIAPDFGSGNVTTLGNISGKNITATGDVTVGSKKAIKLLDAEGGQYIELKAPSTVTDTVTLILPAEYGEANQVLQTDGSGNLTWAAAAEDTNTSLANADQTLTASRTIRLGSNSLTVEGTGANVTLPNESIDTDELAEGAVTSTKIADYTIVNADINTSAAIAGTKISPDFGAQLVTTAGDISGVNITAKGLKLSDADGSNYVVLKAPAIDDDVNLILPASAGTDGQVLQTDGSGTLSWADNYFGSTPKEACKEGKEVWVPMDGLLKKNIDINTKRVNGFCVDKIAREEATWGYAYHECMKENKRLLDYAQWRTACDSYVVGEGLLLPVLLSNSVSLSQQFKGKGEEEWASNSHAVRYIDFVDSSNSVMTKKLISGVGALVARNKDTDDYSDSCDKVRTVMIQWTETFLGGDGVKSYHPAKDKEPKFKYRCAY